MHQEANSNVLTVNMCCLELPGREHIAAHAQAPESQPVKVQEGGSLPPSRLGSRPQGAESGRDAYSRKYCGISRYTSVVVFRDRPSHSNSSWWHLDTIRVKTGRWHKPCMAEVALSRRIRQVSHPRLTTALSQVWFNALFQETLEAVHVLSEECCHCA